MKAKKGLTEALEALEVTVMIDASGSMDDRPNRYRAPDPKTNPNLYMQAINGCDKFIEGLQYSLVPIRVSVRAFSAGGFNTRIINKQAHNEIPTPIGHHGYPGGGTPLYDEMQREMDLLDEGKAKRKALIVLTDGGDGGYGNVHSFTEQIERFFAAGDIVVMIGIGPEADEQIKRIKAVPKKYGICITSDCDVAEVMRCAAEVMLDYLSEGATSTGFTKEHRILATRPFGTKKTKEEV